MAECVVCKVLFPQNQGVGAKRKTCSRTCRNRARLQNPKHALVCLSCGVGFARRDATQRFCSQVCVTSTRRTLKGTTRPCQHCGSIFEPAHRNRKFCSVSCASFGRQGTACRCGQPITSGRICEDCRRSALQSKWHNNTARRRLTSGMTDGAIDRRVVYRRDHGTCRICWGRIDIKARWPNRASLSIDHITPLSRGGSHSYANVRAAHLACNVRRNDGRVQRSAGTAA